MCLTSHMAYCVLALGPQWQFQFKFSPLCLSSVFWQPASGFSPASLLSFIPLKLPPSSSQRVEWRTLYMWSKMGPSGGVKYSQRVPASDTKKKSFTFSLEWLQVWDIPVLREKRKHEDGRVLVFPLPSISVSLPEWACSEMRPFSKLTPSWPPGQFCRRQWWQIKG